MKLQLKRSVWIMLAAGVALYASLVAIFGFQGTVAFSVHFGRVAVAVAVLILYVPVIAKIFDEVPPPRRDYLLAGIILTWASAVGFSFWNEAGRIWHVDTSIFTNPIAGFFSLLLVLGGIFHLIAPDTGQGKMRIIAITIGIITGAGLVFVAPLFR